MNFLLNNNCFVIEDQFMQHFIVTDRSLSPKGADFKVPRPSKLEIIPFLTYFIEQV